VSCEEYRSFRERGVGKCKKCFDSLVALDQKALFLRISAEEIR